MPLTSELSPIVREPSREIIYRQLKRLILQLTLEPLEVLRDGDLAQKLGVSRTPVREALRKLEDEGLVQSQRNQWTRVADVELKHALEIYPVAQSLHVTALRLAFSRLTPRDLLTLKALNTQMAEAVAAQEPATALRLDAQFHQVIVVQAGNPVLSELVTSLTEKLHRIELAHFSQLQSGSVSVQEHQALIKALRSGRLTEAVECMALNWDSPSVADAVAAK